MKTLLRSFAGGEITPELFGRIDDIRVQTGLAKAQNYITLPHGPARKRPGFEFITETRLSGNAATRIIPFVRSPSDAVLIEISSANSGTDGYFRFYQNGAVVQAADASPQPYDSVARGIQGVFTPALALSTTGFPTGTKIVFYTTGGGVLPSPLVAGVTYFAINNGVSSILVATSYANSLLGTAGAITFSNSGSGNRWVNRAYEPGDMVSSGGVNWYCYIKPWNGSTPVDPPASGVASSYWYEQPADGAYQIPHSYNAPGVLPYIRFFQANDVLTLVCPQYPVYTLRRYAAANWAFQQEYFGPKIPAPIAYSVYGTEAGVQATVETVPGQNPVQVRVYGVPGWVSGTTIYGSLSYSTTSPSTHTYGPGFFLATNITGNTFDLVNTDGSPVAAGTGQPLTSSSGSFKELPLTSETTNSYVVTAVDEDGNESLASNIVSVANNLFAEGAYNTLFWSGVAGASKYRIYRSSSYSLFGYIGQVDAAVAIQFKDTNPAADLERTPPKFDTAFPFPATTPFAGGYHEQRKVFAYNQSVWMTRPGTEADLTYSLPPVADDRIAFTIASNELSLVQHVVSLDVLVLLTTGAEFIVSSPDDSVLTPSSVLVRPQSFIGSSHVRPMLVNNSLVFFAARGGHVREMSFRATSQGFVTSDLSLRAQHLFDNLTIVDSSLSKAPYPIVWAVSSNGKLLGATYAPDQEVLGWHQHTVGGGDVFESIAVVPEGNEDRLYAVVRRTINGVTKRYIERMGAMALTTVAASRFLDSGKTFTNPAAGTLGGLSHLAGRTVAILADGVVLPTQTVNSTGQITLPQAYASVHVGLLIEDELQTVPLTLQVEGFGQGSMQNVNRVWVRTVDSGPFRIGAFSTESVPSHSDAPSVRGLTTTAESLRTGRIPVTVPGTWKEGQAQLTIRSRNPLPLTVLGLTLETVVS